MYLQFLTYNVKTRDKMMITIENLSYMPCGDLSKL